MANPIYSFVHSNGKRYYQVWDTFVGYPKTIPLDLITLLQMRGLKNRGNLESLHGTFEHLTEYGSTIRGDRFSIFSQYFQQQAFDLVELRHDDDNLRRAELNSDLENLFVTVRDFDVFYTSYIEKVSNVNPTMPRSTDYYLSWARLMRLSPVFDARWQATVGPILERYGVLTENGHTKGLVSPSGLDDWFKSGYYSSKKEVMTALFQELAFHNLIPVSAVPHILREDECIKVIFRSFGMAHLLPEQLPEYDLFDKSGSVLGTYDDEAYLRGFISEVSHCDFGVSDTFKKMVLINLNKDQLMELMQENYIYDPVVNFEDSFGNLRYPFKYTTGVMQFEGVKFQFLWEYGMQSIHVFTLDGKLIDETGYYDIGEVRDNGYDAMLQDGYSWVRCVYDQETELLSCEPVFGEELSIYLGEAEDQVMMNNTADMDHPLDQDETLDPNYMNGQLPANYGEPEEGDLPF